MRSHLGKCFSYAVYQARHNSSLASCLLKCLSKIQDSLLHSLSGFIYVWVDVDSLKRVSHATSALTGNCVNIRQLAPPFSAETTNGKPLKVT